MMIFQFTIALAVVNFCLSCPAAKKTNLRYEDVHDYHRRLSEIIKLEGRPNSQMNAPVCNIPGFKLQHRGIAGSPAADAKIQLVYKSLRTIFYQLIDSIQNGNPPPLVLTSISMDPLSIFPLTTPPSGPLSLAQKVFRVSNLLGNALRLVFHDAGEVDINIGDLFGSDGCLSDSAPNSGLKEKNTVAMTIIEPLWQNFCDKISRADFWVLFGKIAAESALPNGRFASLVTSTVTPITPGVPVPAINPSPYMPYLNIPFQYGRLDTVGNCNAGANRLPAHQPGLSEFTRVFVNQMGLTVRDGLIVLGAHTVGHVHTQFSGFGFNNSLSSLDSNPTINAWETTPYIFDNIYFDSLAAIGWGNKKSQTNQIVNEGGNPSNPTAYTPTNTGSNVWVNNKQILLNADMVLNYPMSGQSSTGAVKNLIDSPGPGYINDLGMGDIGEACGPISVRDGEHNTNGIDNSNEAIANVDLTFPQIPVPATVPPKRAFGCVKHAPAADSGIRSTLLPKDPNNPTVSLWAVIQSFMTLPNPGTCIDGVSVYNNPLDGATNYYSGSTTVSPVPTYATYSGSIAVPITPARFIGKNGVNGLLPSDSCVPATPSNGEGRDNFYREFEVAWVKMVTAGFNYIHTSTVERVMNGVVSSVTVTIKGSGTGAVKGTLMGTLFDIELNNQGQRKAHILAGANGKILPTNLSFLPSGIMTNGVLKGSSTCYITEIC